MKNPFPGWRAWGWHLQTWAESISAVAAQRAAWDPPRALVVHTPGCRCSFQNIWTNSLGWNGCGRCAAKKWFSDMSKRVKSNVRDQMLLSCEKRQSNERTQNPDRRNKKLPRLRLHKECSETKPLLPNVAAMSAHSFPALQR